ncbi:MAG: hypothetical protein HYZ48_04985 [Chlamydiales bacterium]|nr:hypothetical protein [Chlamydiales bacterium]
MKNTSFKYVLPAAALLVCLTNSSFASTDNGQMRSLESRVSALEQRKGSSGMINPSARPQVKGGANLFITGDLLLWQAHEDGLPLFVENKSFDKNLHNSRVEGLRWNWNAGARVGIGYNSCHDGWDVSATWLHFNTRAHRHEKANHNKVLWPTLTHPGETVVGSPQVIGNGPFQKTTAHWTMNLNQIDLDLGREYYVSKWMTLRPHVGLRTAWLHQKLNTHYNRLSESAGSFTSGIDDHVDMKTQFWGLGLEGGLDTQWGLGSGFSIYADAAWALLYGFHDVDREDQLSYGVKFNWADPNWSFRTTRAIADLELGLRFDSWTNDERVHFRIQAGWEHHIYFSQNQFMRFVSSDAIGNFIGNQGDLTLQGWTLAARLDF